MTSSTENPHWESGQVPIEAGQQLLHYRLIEKIGEGGMGVVWRALDTTLDRQLPLRSLDSLLRAGLL